MSERQVRRYVHQRRRELGEIEAFVPQAHAPGQVAEVDWGQADVVLGGRCEQVNLFLVRLSHSGAGFVQDRADSITRTAIFALASMATQRGNQSGARKYVVDDEGLARWPTTHAEAWIGLLETHKRLTRELEAELEAKHGLTISGLEVMSRLAAADGRTLRLTTLAVETGLSLSRVSRIVDALEARGLVERRPCGEDARAKNAWLTRKGLQLLRAAQRTHFAGVERTFFDQISERDVEALARAFSRFVSD